MLIALHQEGSLYCILSYHLIGLVLAVLRFTSISSSPLQTKPARKILIAPHLLSTLSRESNYLILFLIAQSFFGILELSHISSR